MVKEVFRLISSAASLAALEISLNTSFTMSCLPYTQIVLTFHLRCPPDNGRKTAPTSNPCYR